MQSTSCSLLSQSRAGKAVGRLPILSKYGVTVICKFRSKVGRDNYSVLLPASAAAMNSRRPANSFIVKVGMLFNAWLLEDELVFRGLQAVVL